MPVHGDHQVLSLFAQRVWGASRSGRPGFRRRGGSTKRRHDRADAKCRNRAIRRRPPCARITTGSHSVPCGEMRPRRRSVSRRSEAQLHLPCPIRARSADYCKSEECARAPRCAWRRHRPWCSRETENRIPCLGNRLGQIAQQPPHVVHSGRADFLPEPRLRLPTNGPPCAFCRSIFGALTGLVAKSWPGGACSAPTPMRRRAVFSFPLDDCLARLSPTAGERFFWALVPAPAPGGCLSAKSDHDVKIKTVQCQ